MGALEIYQADNNTNTGLLINTVDNVFNDPNTILIVEDFKELLLSTPDAPFTYEEVSMQAITNSFDSTDIIDTVFNALTIGIDKSIKTQNYYFIDVKEKRNNHLNEMDDNLMFAWVNRIGHVLLDEIEIRIGGHKIDRQYGDWLNIWYELSANRNMENIYFKMIGNVPELTKFDRTIKPKYKLLIPMQFWFNRYNGSSIPLVALEYHDVSYHVKFRNIQDVSYIENNNKIFVSETKDQLFLDEVVGGT